MLHTGLSLQPFASDNKIIRVSNAAPIGVRLENKSLRLRLQSGTVVFLQRLVDNRPMIQRTSTSLRSVAALALLAFLWLPLFAESFHGEHGAIATVQPLATDAGLQALKSGGNAIDAAVAAALTLGVVDGHNSGLGGGCFMLIRLADGNVVAIDGREKAAGAARRDMFLRNGKADAQLSITGALASGVPGALAAYHYALQHYGKLPLKDHLRAAAQIAENGFPINRSYQRALEATAKELGRFKAAREIFLRPDASAWRAGDILKQPDLAKTYRLIAEQGIDWFYQGDFARRTETWMHQNDGILTAADFAGYQIKLRAPIHTTYRGHEIFGFPPPSSGGVHVAQILNVLENFDLKSMGAGSADFFHVVAEAMKLAFADRAFWLGDPDFASVPKGLVEKKYAQELAKNIRLDRAVPVPAHGTPDGAATDVFGRHTTHFSAADADGNWVACTATLNTSFGSKVVVPGTGVVLNNQMDDFSAQPGVANYFGLIGAEANAVAGGKRPLSSMSPTIVLKNGKPILSVGAAGGPTIISQTVLAIIYTVDFGMDLETALTQPRIHHQWRPDELKIEKRVSESIRRELEKRGHKLVVVESMAATQAVEKTGTSFTAMHDPRVEGKAAGW
jgi:gamma-glutamyltranspeptidase/glutathione hydrolase